MKDQRRGKNVAIAGLILQTVMLICTIALWRMTGSTAILCILWLVLGTVGVWLMTLLLFYAGQLARQETMELEDLGQRERTIFEEDDAAMRPAARRLAWMQRWAAPGVTLLLAGYQITLAVVMFKLYGGQGETAITSAGPAAVFMAIVGFAAFLFSRYCTGMGRNEAWGLLRAPASMILACVLLFTLELISMIFAAQGNTVLEPVLVWVFAAIEFIFGAELVLNFVMDIYRPRRPGQAYRPSYESRLFMLLSEPQRVGHSIADTLNYQFGFEVSRTWFYQLLSRAMLPLLIFAVLVMLGISSVVIVEDGQACIVKRFGKVAGVIDAGLNVKWPWPIDTVERFDVGGVHQVTVGLGEAAKVSVGREGETLMIWAEEHGYSGKTERDFLVGMQSGRGVSQAAEEGKAPAVSIIKLVLAVQYRIKEDEDEIIKYASQSVDPKTLIACIVDKEMVAYCASATLDQPVAGDSNRPQGIMTFGRQTAADKLKERIEERVEGMDLGVEITFVGLLSVHPPSEAVSAYEQVLQAEREKDSQRFDARKQANELLAQVAGQPSLALELYETLSEGETFEELQKKRNNPASFAQSLAGAIRQAESQISSLSEELRREKLLGKQPAELADETALKHRYERFLTLLKQAKANPNAFDFAAQIAQAKKRGDVLFGRLNGQPAAMIADASAYRWKRQLGEQTAVLTWRRQLLPYLASPRVYMYDRYVDVLEQTLPNMMKYVLGVDRNAVELRLNLEREPTDVFDAATVDEE